jgi:hypothetical protein
MIRRYCKEIEIMRDSRGQNYRTPYMYLTCTFCKPDRYRTHVYLYK